LGSNYTFVVQLQLDGQTSFGIYKPRDGESPLWDFPSGTLYKREYAAYLLSQVLGWDFIPFTTIRDGPYGVGTVQRFVDHDPKQNYYSLTERSAPQLRTIACFDLIANSTDRKPNHLLLDANGKLWSIDHGLTFHSDTKIRTVIWDFSGEKIPKPLLKRLEKLSRELESPKGSLMGMLELLHPNEVAALRDRVAWVLTEGVYPGLPGRYRRRRR
jgi:uncharacterized repeat protein (TIGR03843 family)